MEAYNYTRLKKGEIRLMEILLERKELVCRIKIYRLPTPEGTENEGHNELQPQTVEHPTSCISKCRYHALSHHWGMKHSSMPTLSVLQDDELYTIDIREGLKQALDTVKVKMIANAYDEHKNPDGWSNHIWVDAICINQKSAHDKDGQLPMMGEIYNNAATVVAWLGPSDASSTQALNFVRRLQSLTFLPSALDASQTKVNADQWRSFAKITRREWFSRLWIVQEIAASKNAIVLCGSDQISWSHFAGAVSLFASQDYEVRQILRESGYIARDSDNVGEIGRSPANTLVEIQSSVLRKKENGEIAEHRQTLEALLTSLSGFQVSESHDAIYAILWLSRDSRPGGNMKAPCNHPYVTTTPQISPTLLTYDIIASPDSANSDAFLTIKDRKQVTAVTGGPNAKATATSSRGSNLTVTIPQSSSRKRSGSRDFSTVSARDVEETLANKTTVGKGITINYESRVFDVCKEVLEHIISTTGSLDILCYPWAPDRQLKDPEASPPRLEDEPEHPTWLVSRRRTPFAAPKNDNPVLRRLHPDPLVGQPGNNVRRYFACGKAKAKSSYTRIEGRRLVVMGYSLGSVTEIGNPASNGIIPGDWAALAGWTDFRGRDPPNQFWRTLVANKGSSESGDPPPRYMLACKWAFSRDFVCEEENFDIRRFLDEGKTDVVTKEYLRRALGVVWNRRFIKSGSNKDSAPLYGIGPGLAEKGDIICILLGCSVPVLLRPHNVLKRTYSQSNSEKQPPMPVLTVNDELQPQNYTFVGECYIDGMMNGECFQFADDRKIKPVDFCIH